MSHQKNKLTILASPGRRTFLIKSLSLLSTLAFSGCGGGGSSSPSPSTSVGIIAPSILSWPADQSILSGERATFTVVANGTEPLSYQWQRNSIDIPGATSPSYTTPILGIGDDAVFSVAASNAAGFVMSRDALLTVSVASVTADTTTFTVDSTRLTVDNI